MKSIFIFNILMSISLSMYAQKAVIVGLNSSYNTTYIQCQNIYGEINDNGLSRGLEYKLTLNYSYGFIVGYNFSNHFGINIKPAYTMQGQDYKAVFSGYTITRSVQMTYIKLPLVFQYELGGEFSKFYAGGGGEYNMLYSSDITAHYNGVSSNGNHSGSDAKKRFNTYDPAFIIVLGGQFKVYKSLYFDAGIRGDYSLIDINANGYKTPNDHNIYHASHNATAGIEIGMHLKLGKSKKDIYFFDR